MDLRLDVVTHRFKSVVAVDAVSLEVERGSFFSLLGPSGSGKTTLLRLIAGFLAPAEGSIFIRETLVNRAPPYRRDTSMVFQNYALFPHMSVMDNVAFGLRYRPVDPSNRKQRVAQALEQVRLTGLDERFPSQLSGGQQQRVALARAIVTKPALLLLDEPLSNLDLRLREQMRSELIGIQRDLGITTVYVTHDQGEAFAMSDRIALMDRGRVVQVGTPRQIFEQPSDPFVVEFIGDSNAFAAVVVESTAAAVIARIDEGLMLRVERAGTNDRLRVGAPVTVHFRQEQIKLSTHSSGTNALPGVVEQAHYLGSLLTYVLRVSEALTVRATLPNIRSNRFDVGERLFAVIDPTDCVVVRSQ